MIGVIMAKILKGRKNMKINMIVTLGTSRT